MTPPPTIPQIMQELQTDFPHLPPEVVAWIHDRWAKDRYDVNLYGAFKRTKIIHEEEAKAA